MMTQWAYLLHIPERLDRRGSSRHIIRFQASAKRSSMMINHVLVIDISRSGLRLMTSESLQVGGKIAIDLPEVGQVMGTIRWKDDVQYGLEFSARLSRAELATTRLAGQTYQQYESAQALLAHPLLAHPWLGGTGFRWVDGGHFYTGA